MRKIKIILAVVSLLLVVFCIASCDKNDVENKEDVYYTVAFNTAGGTEMGSIRVLAGTKLATPENPTKEGYIFSNWKNGTVVWDFSRNTVNSDITLSASWIDVRSIFEYVVDGDEVTITGFRGGVADVETPSVIEGYPVTAIGEGAFEGLTYQSLRSIVIGESIVSIGDRAFANCTDIKITVKAKPQSIGRNAFFGCEKLERIELGSGLEVISFEAFSGCKGLKEVVLSDTVTTISENAFEFCTALENLVAHSSLSIVEDSAFADCAVFAVCYYGTPEEWAETEISDGNSGNALLRSARLYIYSEVEPDDSVEGNFWYFDKNGRIRVW